MNILFVCTGNTCRSPMAKALLEEMAKEKGLDINVKSAGVFAFDGEKASKGAIESMKAEGLDLKGHRANIIHRDLLEEADLILTMGLSHKELLISKFDFIQGKVYTLKEYAYGKEEDIDDPFGGNIQAYNKAKEDIKEALKEMVNQLTEGN
ncbi:low molecular weight protein arginine phosphatase [Clostridium sp. Cult2]|uniref:low molecular weight protein arginine phosphatase n=1 Tax=Clostridium sp. Cult2 TaxID=2079003 RepID=UPI001F2CE8CE|nr:protein tyrosine phosphatase [Clostridium sp. Cult2]